MAPNFRNRYFDLQGYYKTLAFFLLLTAHCLLPTAAKATHLMGGWSGYQYLGLNSATGNYQYQVTVKVYRYCDDVNLPCGSCATAVLDQSVNLGAYIQDWLSPNDPNKVLAASFTLPLTSQSWVPLPGAAQCATAPTVCVEEGIYTDIIEVPPSNGGYHFIFQRCCRNGNIINLANPGGEGMMFYSFVPPTFVNNSSPTFAQPPVPYICVNDTASILNTAFDPDGDVIVYSLVHPYSTDPPGNAIPPLPNPYTFPLPLVTFQGGYSASQPFGPSGYASVNGFTGLSQYLSPTTGNFVVAVELQEYRNNQLVGITRLDMQIIVINCPPNNPPVLSSSTSQINYIANVGDTLCFPITFTDVNNDTVYFSASGSIFSNPPTNPPATITPNPNAGVASVTSQFCWNISCAQAGNYFFIVQAPDDGCPPKITNVVYTIQVLPYTGPTSISGLNPICSNSPGTYSVSAASGTSFTWTATGGTILAGQGTNTVSVNWGSGPNGSVSVTAYNKNGCAAAPLTLNVSIQSVTVAAGPNSTVCAGNPVSLSGSGGSTYSWSPSGGLSNSTISNPVATPTASTVYTVTVTSSAGCTNTGTVSVNVNPLPVINSGGNKTLCTGNSLTLGGSPTGPAGSTYNWSPSTGLSCSTCANPVANPTVATTYTLAVTNTFGCTDTAFVAVTVGPLPVANAGANVTICPGRSTTLSGNGGGAYNWSPSSSLSNANISNPVASPTANTTYTLVVNLNGCLDTAFVSVTALPKPAVNAGADISICRGSSGTLNATGTGNFSWSPSTNLSCTLCSNPVANPTATTNYTVTITDASSCTNTDTIRVSVNALPIANAGPKPAWVCPGFGITLNSANGVTYSWSPSMGLSNQNISNPVSTPTATTTYTVYITDANGCKNSDTITVVRNAAVPTNAGSNKTMCVGQSTSIGGAPTSPVGTTYLWSPAAGLNNSTLANPTATPVATTTYIVSTSSDTCNGADTVIVFVNQLPVISGGANISICRGSGTTLTASGGTSYSWSTTATTTSISVAPTTSSAYTVTGTNANGCVNTSTVTVFVNGLPTINAGADVSICRGNAATLTAGGGNLYSWNTGATTTSVFVSPTNAAGYTVTGTDVNGCVNTDTVRVFVNTLPVISAGADISICRGNGATLTASGGNLYSWSTGATNTTVSVSPTTSSNYTVTGTDVNGCVNRDTVVVFVNTLPAISAGPDITVCNGSTVTLTASGGIAYSWNTNATTTAIMPVVTSTGTYTVTGTDVNGCSNFDTVRVVVKPLPAISAGPNVSICRGAQATLTASGGMGYSWSTGATTASIYAAPTSTSTYTVTGTGVNACVNNALVTVFVNALPPIMAGADVSICTGSSATLTASGGSNYSWSTTATTTTISVSPTSLSSYIVLGTDANGCSKRDTVRVFVNLLPSINGSPDVSICSGKTTTLTASGGTNYSWSTGAITSSVAVLVTSSATYTVIGTDVNNCSNMDTVRVFVLALPAVTISNDASICAGDSVFLAATGGVGYSWAPPNFLNSTNISNPIATPNTGIQYTVTVTNIDGCTKSDSVRITVNPLPIISAGADQTLCPGNTLTLTASGGTIYLWSTGETTTAIAVAPGAPFTYTLTGTDANGCSSNDSVHVAIGTIPIANFNYSLSLACEGIEVQFTDSSLNALGWAWNFGDGNPSSLQNPVHTYPYNSNYLVTLIAKNPPCSDTAQKTISLLDLSNHISFRTSNVFTPNSDGINDCFNLVPEVSGGAKAAFDGCADLTIYNRWGIVVYHSGYSGSCWDGRTSAGMSVPEGTYFYIFSMEETELKGFITILR